MRSDYSTTTQKLAIVIVHYNSDGLLLDCVQSILSSQPHMLLENIFIIDNLSTDGTLERCRNKYQKFSYVYNSQNIGFAAAANIGARRALEKGATHVLFCNPDAILGEGCIDALVARASHEAGAYSPTIKYAHTGQVWFNGGSINYWRQRAVHQSPAVIGNNPYDTGYISGCVMCVSAEVFSSIGLFDERFFLYYEDVDFSLRAQKAKFATQVLPHAHAVHMEQSERLGDQKIYFLVLAGLLFFEKNTPSILRVWWFVYTALRRFINIIKNALHKPHAQAVRWAFQDYGKAKNSSHFIPHRHL